MTPEQYVHIGRQLGFQYDILQDNVCDFRSWFSITQ